MAANLSVTAKTMDVILNFYPIRKLVWINQRHSEQVLMCLFNKHERYSIKATLFGWKRTVGAFKIPKSPPLIDERK
jgi:hypothetical protein